MIELGPSRKLVWLASYPRSGNTWTRIFLHNLLDLVRGEDSGGADINDLKRYSLWEASQALFESHLRDAGRSNDWAAVSRARPRMQADIARRSDRPVILKTHLAILTIRGNPTINLAATAGAVYLIRNPLDVVISLAAHLGGTVDEMIDMMADTKAVLGANMESKDQIFEPIGTWSGNVEGWTTGVAPTRLVMRYEDMIADPVQAFSKIARHMRITASPEQVALAVRYSEIQQLQKQERERGFKHRSKRATDAFFRSGRSGGWRDRLSAAQVDRIVADHREQMSRFGYLPEQVEIIR